MKCIQHSRHGTIFRMPNEDAHLLVSSGRYVYISTFKARDAALSPRRLWLARIGMFVAAALAIVALLMLTTSAQAAKLDCLTTQAQARKVYPAQALKYRQINDTRCWYAGRTRAKSEFSLPATASSRGGTEYRRAKTGNMPGSVPGAEMSSIASSLVRSTVRGAAIQPSAGVMPGPREATYDEQINDAFLALCGGPCPQLMAFEDRWDIAMGKQR